MWYEPSTADQIKPLPWLAPKVILHLQKILRPDFEVIEHGSGGSTLWLAERVKFVTVFEGSPKWSEALARQAPKNVLINPDDDEIIPRKYDLFLIDGEPIEARKLFITIAVAVVKPGGWVVLDNANRPEYATERGWLQSICESYETFDSGETNTKYLVTEFYKMKG